MKMKDSGWTVARVKNSLSCDVRDYHQKHSEKRQSVFYSRIVELQNLVEAEGWKLDSPKFNKTICSFMLTEQGDTGIKRIFGILISLYLPGQELTDRNGEKLTDHSIASNPPRIVVTITEREARELEQRHGCKFWGIDREKWVYYNIPDNIADLLPVLEFAYNKHRRR